MIRIFGSLSLVLLVSLYFGASNLKYETRDAREELQELDREIDREKEAISVLSAEWSYLTRPDNLRKLAETHLGLDTVRAEQVAAIEDIPWLGYNLFDQDPAGVPVSYDSVPRPKPSVVVPVQEAPETRFITIAQVNFDRDERWGY